MSTQDKSNTHNNMAAERATTPTTSVRSRASTIILDSSDQGTPAPSQPQMTISPSVTTPPASETGRELVKVPINLHPVEITTNEELNLSQFLMVTKITLEYGEKFKQHITIHKEMICCHSSAMQSRFKKAEALRISYSSADKLRKDLKRLVYPRVSAQDFDEEHKENEAIPLIVRIYDQYPLIPFRRKNQQVGLYRAVIQEFVDAVIGEQVTKKNVIGPGTKTAMQKKDLKGMGVQSRLQALQSKGVLSVAEQLSEKLWKIKDHAKAEAETDTQTAAAQGRIMLRDAEDHVVKTFVHWLYNHGTTLQYGDAQHLYKLHALAAELGITRLAEQCLSRLAAETARFLDHAFSDRISLQQVLHLGSNPEADDDASAQVTNNIIQVVFRHVLGDLQPPERLVTLVVTTLAQVMDPSLWAALGPMMNLDISHRLIGAMVAHRQVKFQAHGGFSIKSEGDTANDKKALLPLNE